MKFAFRSRIDGTMRVDPPPAHAISAVRGRARKPAARGAELDALRQRLRDDEEAIEAGFTLAHFACAENCPLPILVAALDADESSELRLTADGELPLHLAAREGSGEAVAELLRRHSLGALAQDKWGDTPLHNAARGAHAAAIARLMREVEVAAAATQRNKQGRTPLQLVPRLAHQPELVGRCRRLLGGESGQLPTGQLEACATAAAVKVEPVAVKAVAVKAEVEAVAVQAEVQAEIEAAAPRSPIAPAAHAACEPTRSPRTARACKRRVPTYVESREEGDDDNDDDDDSKDNDDEDNDDDGDDDEAATPRTAARAASSRASLGAMAIVPLTASPAAAPRAKRQLVTASVPVANLEVGCEEEVLAARAALAAYRAAYREAEVAKPSKEGLEAMGRSCWRPDHEAGRKMQGQLINQSFDWGHPRGVEVGCEFPDRRSLMVLGVHNQTMKGIHAKVFGGVHFTTSIVSSGGYEADSDNGESMTYTGEGGNDFLGRRAQVVDQTATGGNVGLINCAKHGVPVRVVRCLCKQPRLYRYEGLFDVTRWEQKVVGDAASPTAFVFHLRRRAGQLALQGRSIEFGTARIKNARRGAAVSHTKQEVRDKALTDAEREYAAWKATFQREKLAGAKRKGETSHRWTSAQYRQAYEAHQGQLAGKRLKGPVKRASA